MRYNEAVVPNGTKKPAPCNLLTRFLADSLCIRLIRPEVLAETTDRLVHDWDYQYSTLLSLNGTSRRLKVQVVLNGMDDRSELSGYLVWDGGPTMPFKRYNFTIENWCEVVISDCIDSLRDLVA